CERSVCRCSGAGIGIAYRAARDGSRSADLSPQQFFCRTSLPGGELPMDRQFHAGVTTMSTDPLPARASAERPYFLGFHLRQAAERHGWTDTDLARELGCTAEALTMIRLCRAPQEGAGGIEDIRCVAERFGCDTGRLAATLGVLWE